MAGEICRERQYASRPGPACEGYDFTVIPTARDKDYVKMSEVDLSLWCDFSDILLEE